MWKERNLSRGQYEFLQPPKGAVKLGGTAVTQEIPPVMNPPMKHNLENVLYRLLQNYMGN